MVGSGPKGWGGMVLAAAGGLLDGWGGMVNRWSPRTAHVTTGFEPIHSRRTQGRSPRRLSGVERLSASPARARQHCCRCIRSSPHASAAKVGMLRRWPCAIAASRWYSPNGRPLRHPRRVRQTRAAAAPPRRQFHGAWAARKGALRLPFGRGAPHDVYGGRSGRPGCVGGAAGGC